MTDYLYKFPDEQTAQTALADYYDSEPSTEGHALGWKTNGEGYALDLVGILTAETDELDEEGHPIFAPLDGWHINLRVMDDRPDPAPEYAVTPTQQRRVWL
jgi:hypothetical protein